LDQTRDQLRATPGQELEQARADLEAVWRTRLADLLEEHMEVADELQVLVDQIRSELPASAVSASGHGVAAGQDVNITASGGAVAAAVIDGNVAPPGPTDPGPARG
jgi:hypothetical protein